MYASPATAIISTLPDDLMLYSNMNHYTPNLFQEL